MFQPSQDGDEQLQDLGLRPMGDCLLVHGHALDFLDQTDALGKLAPGNEHGMVSESGNLRAVVVLRYYADLPYATIAEALELPLGTVKSCLNQALFKFRGEIEALTAGQAAHGDRLVKESAQ